MAAIDFKIRDRVMLNPTMFPKHYTPGPGVVTKVTPTRVVVKFDDARWGRPLNYKPEKLVLLKP